MSKVLIVGNGFDIALGLPTKYSDFVNKNGIVDNAYWPFRDLSECKFKDSSLHKYFYDYFIQNRNNEGNIQWIDIEGELLNYVRNRENYYIDEEIVNDDRGSFMMLKRMLQRYINDIFRLNNLESDEYLLQLIEAIKVNGNFNKAYSFNYTDLKEELEVIGKFKEDEVPQVIHVHRAIAEDNTSNIVLGIKEDTSLPQAYSFMFKSSQTESTDLAKDMCNADECLIYGLSLGEIDFPYFESFFNQIKEQPITDDKKYITIFTYGENCVNSIINNLHNAGILIKELQEHSYFNIIDMENVWKPGYDKTRFNTLLERLKSKK